MSVLEVRHLTKRFRDVVAVDDVSFEVATGETLAMIGPNGAGKTTVFAMIAGEHEPTAGQVLLGGRDVTHWPASRLARARVSRTFQVARQLGSRTVWENVAVAVSASQGTSLRAWDIFARNNRRKVDATLDRLDLAELRDVPAAELTHGNRKLLELAMALAQDPSLLLLDEPTAGMATEAIRPTIELIDRLRREDKRLTIVISAHDMEVVFGLAQRVILLAEGRKVLDGTPQEIEHDPVTREIYLGSEAG
jgi:branched-chain amino acid transport system ATP-binding protein